MPEEIEITEEMLKEEELKNLPKKGELIGNERKLTDIAEVRMVLYVVPIASLLALFVYVLTSCSGK